MIKKKIRSLADGYSYEADTTNEQEWYQLLRKFDDGNIHQTWAYALTEEDPRNISPLILKLNGEVVAAALVRFRRFPFLGIGLAYVHRAPIWLRTGMDVNVEHFRQALRALRNEFVCKRGMVLRINSGLFDDNSLGLSRLIAEEGFLPTRYQARIRTILFDLTPSLEVLRHGISRNWRRNLKRDEEADLEFVEGSDGKLIDGIESIYGEMVSRKAFSASESIGRLRQVQEGLPDDLKLKIMLCKSQGEICAGLAWSAIGDTGIELIAATSNAGTRLGGSHLLRWKAVESLKQQGIVLYNLNGINPAGNPGTYRFKKDLAGTHGRDVFLLGKFDATPGLLSASLLQLRDMLRMWKKRLLR